MIKRVIKFILFKIVEGAALVGYVTGSYEFWTYIGLYNSDSEKTSIVAQYIFSSIITFLAAVIIWLVGWGLVIIVKKNWEWAK